MTRTMCLRVSLLLLALGLGSLLGCGEKRAVITIDRLDVEVRHFPSGDPNYLFLDLAATLRERGGVGVQLTGDSIEIGGLSSDRPLSTRLQAHSTTLISRQRPWYLAPGPALLRYSVAGVDDLGTKVSASSEQTVAVHP